MKDAGITTEYIRGEKFLFADISLPYYRHLHRQFDRREEVIVELVNCEAVETTVLFRERMQADRDSSIEQMSYKLNRLKQDLINIEIYGYDKNNLNPILIHKRRGVLETLNGFHRSTWLRHLGRSIPAIIRTETFIDVKH